jgi:hypothetical protein
MTYDIAYMFTENPLTLKQIVLAPQHCFGLPKPPPCTECALETVLGLQEAVSSCNSTDPRLDILATTGYIYIQYTMINLITTCMRV